MTKAVLIAGGKGERLRPVTFEIPKAMISVRGEKLIEHSINLYWNNKVYEVWLNLGHMHHHIRKEYPTMPFWIDANNDGKITPIGTGGWLNNLAKSSGKDYWFDHFYVNNVDNLMNVNLKEMMNTHIANKNVVTIACTHVTDVREYGSVAIKDGRIANFEEKKRSRVKKPGYVNAGYYIFSPKVFSYVDKLGIDINNPMSLEKDLFPLLAKEGVLGAYVSNGQWFDTGTFERWEKAIKEWNGLNG